MSEPDTGETNDSFIKSLSVLIIDDQKTMRGIVRQLLGQIGISNIRDYEDGDPAWQALTQNTIPIPDFIICDLHMVGMDGLEFVNKIRRSKNVDIRHIPVLILTGDPDTLLHQVADQVGAAKILGKPISAPDLRDEITSIIGLDIQS